MPDHDDTLRGSTPIYSAKDILVRLESKVESVDGKVDKIDKDLAVILAQNLEPRVQRLESWQQRVIGLAYAASLLSIVATVLAIVRVIAP